MGEESTRSADSEETETIAPEETVVDKEAPEESIEVSEKKPNILERLRAKLEPVLTRDFSYLVFYGILAFIAIMALGIAFKGNENVFYIAVAATFFFFLMSLLEYTNKFTVKTAEIVALVITLILCVLQAADVEVASHGILMVVFGITVVLSFIFHFLGSVFLVITSKEFSQNGFRRIKDSIIKWKNQIIFSVVLLTIVGVLALLAYNITGLVALGLSAVLMFVTAVLLLVLHKKEKLPEKNYLYLPILTVCLIMGIVMGAFYAKTAYDTYNNNDDSFQLMLTILILAISWGWCASKVIARFFGKTLDIRIFSLVLLAFSFSALSFYIWTGLGDGDRERWASTSKSLVQIAGVAAGIYAAMMLLEKDRPYALDAEGVKAKTEPSKVAEAPESAPTEEAQDT